jgi:hypothetical protein
MIGNNADTLPILNRDGSLGGRDVPGLGFERFQSAFGETHPDSEQIYESLQTGNNYTPDRGGIPISLGNLRADYQGQTLVPRVDKGPIGKRGKNFTEKVRVDLEQKLKQMVIQNFGRLIEDGTGTLRRSIEEGHLLVDTDSSDNLQFKFSIASISRPQRQGEKVAMMTRGGPYGGYGTLVFEGRGAILSNNIMTYQSKGHWYRSHLVRGAEPRNPFELDIMQIRELAFVLGRNIGKQFNQAVLG